MNKNGHVFKMFQLQIVLYLAVSLFICLTLLLISAISDFYLIKRWGNPTKTMCFFEVNFFMTEAPIIEKPVHWFAEQIWGSATLLKNNLQHRCFPVKFAKFLRTPFFTDHFQWLPLFFKGLKWLPLKFTHIF